MAGIWCIVNAVVGATGNFLTILAIPEAKRNNRFVINGKELIF